jgi:hypothetical protein
MDLMMAQAFWSALGGYLGVGLAFALTMIAGGFRRLDPLAQAAPWHVKLVLIPGLAALWPIMLIKFVRGRRA